jgi:hypothetical protein
LVAARSELAGAAWRRDDYVGGIEEAVEKGKKLAAGG